jgi:AcrR family transcriptional regulator
MTAELVLTGMTDVPLQGRVRKSRRATPPVASKRAVGRPRGSNADARREMIVSAAVRVFAHRGFDATTLQEVADRADITRPAVHHYFPGKAPLYRAALDRACELVMTPAAVQPLKAFVFPAQGELRVASALLGTSLAQAHRMADIAPRITKIADELRQLCEQALGPDGGEHDVDPLVAVVVGRWVLTASALSWEEVDAEFDLRLANS